MAVFNPTQSDVALPEYLETQFEIETDDVVGFTDAQRLAQELQFTFSVINEATWLYKNYKYPRYRNFYGYAQLMSGAYVVKDIELVHINQELLYWHDSMPYIVQEVHCSEDRVIEAVVAQSDKVLQEPELTAARLIPYRQRYTSIRFRLCPGVEANIAIRWAEIRARCSNVFDPPDKQGNPIPSNNEDGGGGGRPSGQGDDPIDKSKNDGKDDPEDDKPEEPKPGRKTARIGQWFEVYTGYNPGCQSQYAPRRYALVGATNSAITPILNRSGTGSCGGDSFDGTVTYDGVIVDTPRDCTSCTFDFVPG